MKLIKWIAIWLGVGLALRAGMTNLVDASFADYFSPAVMTVCLGLGLFMGVRAQMHRRKTKERISTAMNQMAASKDRQEAWAASAKKTAAEIQTRCEENENMAQENPLFAPVYCADELLSAWMTELSSATELQGRLRAAVQTMEEEGSTV